MLALRYRLAPQLRKSMYRRAVSTLSSNPDIKVFPNPLSPSNSYLLTYLDTSPPSPNLAIGQTSEIPPTPRSFEENPRFLGILNEVLAEHAIQDEDLRAAAQAFASPGGTALGSGGGVFWGGNTQQQRSQKGKRDSGGAGGASNQGGAGGGGVGGYCHLSDRRNPPDFGRIAWPEDIFGSVEVDGHGQIQGNFQPSGTYRILTNDGILGLSPFLTQKLVSRLRDEEKKERIA